MTAKRKLERVNALQQTELLEIVGDHYREIDADLAAHSAEVTCRKGCTACCHELVSGELVEAEYIVANAPDAVRRALPRFQEHEDRLYRILDPATRAALGTSGPDLAGARSAAIERASKAWFRERVPCAFLDADGTCTVYAYRPHACRTYAVLSDPALCSDPDATVIGWGREYGAHMWGLLVATVKVARRDAIGFLPTLMRTAWERREVSR
jgi:Fe-S-cluster containining protein